MNNLDLHFSDKYLSHQVNLLRFTAGEQKKVTTLLVKMQKELKTQLNNGLSDYSKARKRRVLKQANEVIDKGYTDMGAVVDSKALARHEAEFTAQTFAEIGLEASLPTEAALKALVNGSLIEGAPTSAWWAKQSQDLQFKFASQVRQGIAQNETLQQIIRRVAGSKKLGIPGIMDVSRRNASALVHSSVMQVANDARMATFRANDDIVKGTRFLATLDSHTSLTCVAHSGAEWDLEGNPIQGNFPFEPPPLHFNCLPGNTVVSAAGVSKQYKRWFDGEVVVLSITGIDDVTITPNHPVLTDHGWVKAGLLKKGDNLVFCDDTEAVISIINPKNNHMKARIEDIGDSLLMPGGMTAPGVKQSPSMFHGDGMEEGEVVIAHSYADCKSHEITEHSEKYGHRPLIGEPDGQATFLQTSQENHIDGTSQNHGCKLQASQPVLLRGLRTLLSFGESCQAWCNGYFDRISAQLRAGVRRFQLNTSGFLAVASVSVGGAIPYNDGLPSGENLSHLQISDAVAHSTSHTSFSDRTSRDELYIQNMFSWLNLNTAIGKSQEEKEAIVRKLGLVKIKDVTVRKYSSHVYNLQSDFGWYMVNITEPQSKSKGIIVHNCRSLLVPITLSYRELGIDVDEPKGTRASDLGQIPSDTSFDSFLKRHDAEYVDNLLGPGRAQLWRDGKITLQDLLNQNGRPLSLKQLGENTASNIISDAQKKAVLDYTGGQYLQVNGYLRGTRKAISEGASNTIKELDGFMKTAPKVAAESYRGITLDQARFNEWKTLKKGSKFIDQGFLSTSQSKGVATAFQGSAKYQVEMTIRGKNGVLVEALSDAKAEKEILFSRGSLFNVQQIKVVEKGGIGKINMVLVEK